MALLLPQPSTAQGPLDYPLPVVAKRITTLAADHKLDPEPHHLAAKNFKNVYQAQAYLLSFFHNLQLHSLYEKLLSSDSRFIFSQHGRVSGEQVARNRKALLRSLQKRALPFAAIPKFLNSEECDLQPLFRIDSRPQLLAIFELLKANGEADREHRDPLRPPRYDVSLLLEKIELFQRYIAWHELSDVFLKYRLDLDHDALKVIQYIVQAREQVLESEALALESETDFLAKAEKLVADRATYEVDDEFSQFFERIDRENPLRLGDPSLLSNLNRLLAEYRLPPRGYVEIAKTLSTDFQLRAFYLSLRNDNLWQGIYEELTQSQLRYPGTTYAKTAKERESRGNTVALYRQRLREELAKRMISLGELPGFVETQDMSAWKGLSLLNSENQMDAFKVILAANLRSFRAAVDPLGKPPLVYSLPLFLQNAPLFRHPVAVVQTHRIFLANQLELNESAYAILNYLVESVEDRACRDTFQ